MNIKKPFAASNTKSNNSNQYQLKKIPVPQTDAPAAITDNIIHLEAKTTKT